MKIKSLIFTALVFGALATTSCSKEKDCECVTSTTGLPDSTTSIHIKDGDCSDSNSEVTSLGITVKTVCTEK